MPSSADIELPPIHVHAEYKIVDDASLNTPQMFSEGLRFRPGNYLSATAEVGAFEHCLTTDLLNHLVFVQKIFVAVRDPKNNFIIILEHVIYFILCVYVSGNQ